MPFLPSRPLPLPPSSYHLHPLPFSLLIQTMYNDGGRAFGNAKEMAVDERMHIAMEGVVSIV